MASDDGSLLHNPTSLWQCANFLNSHYHKSAGNFYLSRSLLPSALLTGIPPQNIRQGLIDDAFLQLLRRRGLLHRRGFDIRSGAGGGGAGSTTGAGAATTGRTAGHEQPADQTIAMSRHIGKIILLFIEISPLVKMSLAYLCEPIRTPKSFVKNETIVR